MTSVVVSLTNRKKKYDPVRHHVRRVIAVTYFILDYVQTYESDDDDDDDKTYKQQRFGQHEPCYVSVI